MTLYEINQEIESVLENAIDMETGEISEEALQKINELQMAKDVKVENVALWHKNLLAESNKESAGKKEVFGEQVEMAGKLSGICTAGIKV